MMIPIFFIFMPPFTITPAITCGNGSLSAKAGFQESIHCDRSGIPASLQGELPKQHY
jgi:hypothetical protein